MDGFMSIPIEARLELLETILEGSKPKFKLTQPGDPEKMRSLKATLPNISNTYKLEELNELYEPNPIITRTMGRAMAREMWRLLFDLEMSLCGGG